MQSQGLNVIGINYNDTLEDVQTFRKQFELTMPLVLGGGGDKTGSRVIRPITSWTRTARSSPISSEATWAQLERPLQGSASRSSAEVRTARRDAFKGVPPSLLNPV